MAYPLVEPLILDLLEWVAKRREAAYEEVMDAWPHHVRGFRCGRMRTNAG